MSIQQEPFELEYDDLDEGLFKDISNKGETENKIEEDINRDIDKKSSEDRSVVHTEYSTPSNVTTTDNDSRARSGYSDFANLNLEQEIEQELGEMQNSLERIQNHQDQQSEQITEFREKIEDIQIERESVIDKQEENSREIDELVSKADRNESKIENIAKNQEFIKNNQLDLNKQISELVQSLNHNLFLPFAKGLTIFSAISTVVLILDRSLAAVPFLVLFLLFLTATIKGKRKNNDR